MHLQETVANIISSSGGTGLKKQRVHRNAETSTADFKGSFVPNTSPKYLKLEKSWQKARRQWTAVMEDLKDSHQMSLTESQQETENLQREMEALRRQCEDEVRFLEEQLEVNAADFERERERLLLLQDELSEQLALKEGFLQDVQEEEEDASRATAPPKHSPSAQTSDLPASDDSSDEAARWRICSLRT